jgi:hypothetical protein
MRSVDKFYSAAGSNDDAEALAPPKTKINARSKSNQSHDQYEPG